MKPKTKRRSKVAVNMAQAAGALGTSVDVVRAAKRAGCAAFNSNGSVDLDELKEWLADPANADAMAPAGGGNIREQKTFQEWRKLKTANDKADGLLIERTEVAATIQRIGARVRQLLAQKLRNEYPTAVAGLDPPAARVYGMRIESAVLAEWQKMVNEWGGK